MTKLISIRKYLYESTRTVQEVYANRLEMLWVEEQYGMEVRNQVYEKNYRIQTVSGYCKEKLG